MATSMNVTSAFRQAYLLETLGPLIVRQDTPEEWALLEDPLTPQAKALQWMSEDDIFSSDPESLEDKILLERYVLAVLYFSTSGPDWYPIFPNDLAWDFSEFPYLNETLSVCDWNKASGVEFSFYDSPASSPNPNGFGVLCTTTSENDVELVSSVSLHLLNMTGTTPWELSLLERLSHLSLPSNRITGTLPPELADLSELQDLILSDNYELSGTIPTELGKLSKLSKFSIVNTLIGGSIPTELGNLQQLLVLDLYNLNPLTGTLPTEIGLMSSLTEIAILGQLLTGTIPTEFGNLSNLKYLHLEEMPGLTGTLPTELDSLEFEFFAFINTSLTGSMEFLCPLDWDMYALLQADCLEEVECSCCTTCCDNSGYCENSYVSGGSFLPPDFVTDDDTDDSDTDDNDANDDSETDSANGIVDGGVSARLSVPVAILHVMILFSTCFLWW